MTKYAFAAHALRVARFRQPEKFLNLSNLDGTSLDLAHLLHGFLRDVQAAPLRDERFDHYLSVEQISAKGRRITFTAEYGKYGIEGNIKNVRTNKKTHAFGQDESPVISVRHMIVVPQKSDVAFFLAERCGGRGAASMFYSQLARAFRRRFEDDHLLIHRENLTDEKAWREFQERAHLTQIKVVRYRVGHDLADGLRESNIGDLEYTIKPFRSGALGKHLVNSLLDQSIHPETQILGLRDDVKADEVRLVLTDGDQQKQIVLGRDGIPTLVYPIKTSHDERPTDKTVYTMMDMTIEQLAKELLVELESDWCTSPWDNRAKSVGLRAVRDER